MQLSPPPQTTFALPNKPAPPPPSLAPQVLSATLNLTRVASATLLPSPHLSLPPPPPAQTLARLENATRSAVADALGVRPDQIRTLAVLSPTLSTITDGFTFAVVEATLEGPAEWTDRLYQLLQGGHLASSHGFVTLRLRLVPYRPPIGLKVIAAAAAAATLVLLAILGCVVRWLRRHTHRVRGQRKGIVVFLSYRVASDARAVEALHRRLVAQGVDVWFDKVCLEDGQLWADGFANGLAASHVFVPVMSKEGLAPFASLRPDSMHCDNVLLEYCLALELLRLQRLKAIYPIFVGSTLGPLHRRAEHFFREGGLPTGCAEAPIDGVDTQLNSHMQRLGLGTAACADRSPAAVLRAMTAHQGGFIAGDRASAWARVTRSIAEMASDLGAQRDAHRLAVHSAVGERVSIASTNGARPSFTTRRRLYDLLLDRAECLLPCRWRSRRRGPRSDYAQDATERLPLSPTVDSNAVRGVWPTRRVDDGSPTESELRSRRGAAPLFLYPSPSGSWYVHGASGGGTPMAPSSAGGHTGKRQPGKPGKPGSGGSPSWRFLLWRSGSGSSGRSSPSPCSRTSSASLGSTDTPPANHSCVSRFFTSAITLAAERCNAEVVPNTVMVHQMTQAQRERREMMAGLDAARTGGMVRLGLASPRGGEHSTNRFQLANLERHLTAQGTVAAAPGALHGPGGRAEHMNAAYRLRRHAEESAMEQSRHDFELGVLRCNRQAVRTLIGSGNRARVAQPSATERAMGPAHVEHQGRTHEGHTDSKHPSTINLMTASGGLVMSREI